MANAYMVANSYAGLGIEGTRGTASTNIKWTPIMAPQVTPGLKWLRDEHFRGSAGDTYGLVAGVRADTYDFRGYAFADTIGVPLVGVLGNQAISGSGPYTHTIGLANSLSTGSQPPSITIQDDDGANPFQILGAQVQSMQIKFGAEAALEYSCKLVGNPATILGSPPSSTFSSEVFIPGWNVAVTLGGTSTAVLVEGDITIDRKAAPIFTGGTQAPRYNFAGGVKVDGRMRFVVEASDPIMTTSGSTGGVANTQSTEAVVLTFTEPSSTHTIALTMSAVQFHDAMRKRDKDYVEVETQFEATMNSTDAVATGFAPIKAVLSNSVAAVY